MTSQFQTPGVYINEVNAFPNAIAPVATAVPAFIGYLPTARINGEPCTNRPVRITSMAEFQAIFLLPDPPPPASPAVQYDPHYYLVAEKGASSPDALTLNGQAYAIVPDPDTIYQLYNAVRLFYANGGGEAYVVAVGTYGPPSGRPQADPTARTVNGNVSLADLMAGLATLKTETEPTLLVCPDAVMLSDDDHGAWVRAVLAQSEETQTTFGLFDVPGGDRPTSAALPAMIDQFRSSIGGQNLDRGAAYFPFVGVEVMQADEINQTNLFGGDLKQLMALLSPPTAPSPTVAQIIGQIRSAPDALTRTQASAALIVANPLYGQIVDHVLQRANILPPASAMAGVITVSDNAAGVWQAPANMSIAGASCLPINLSDPQLGPLNIDAVTGKSINALRQVPGRGVVIWGARTLDGNSQDWRYINVRRTLTYIEQSVKQAARAYVFAPNDANTWEAVKSAISNLLTSLWMAGGLAGPTSQAAFNVQVGLGSTMTADDILNGDMVVSVKVAVTHPAEFIVINFAQQQPTA